MPPRDAHHLAFRTLLPLLVALALWPLWAVDLLPMPGFVTHLRVATILHDWQTLPLYRTTFKRLPFPTPLSGFAYLTHELARLHDVEWAGRVVLTLALLGLVLAARALLAVAGHSRWLLLGMLPWLLNPDLFQGDAPLVLALPLIVAALALHLRLLQMPSPWPALGLALTLAALAMTHWLWLVVMLLLPMLAIWQGIRLGLRQLLLGTLWTVVLSLPSAALLLPWARQAWPLLPHTLAGQPSLPLEGGRRLIDSLFDVFAPHGPGLDSVAELFLHRPGGMASFLWLVGLFLWLLGSIRQQREQPRAVPVGVDGTGYLAQALVLLLIGYLVAPALLVQPLLIATPGARLVDLLAILAVLALPLQPLAPPRSARLRTWAGTLAFLVVAIQLPLSSLEALLLSRTELGPIRDVYAHVPVGSRVATLHARVQGRWLRAPVLANLGHWYDVLDGGLAPDPLPDPWLQPVRVRPGQQRPMPPNDPETFRWKEHGRWYDWFVVYAQPGDPPAAWDAFLRTLPRVYQRSGWSVYQNLDVVPWPPPPELTPAEHRAANRLTECALGLQGWRVARPTVLEADGPDHWLRTRWKCPEPDALRRGAADVLPWPVDPNRTGPVDRHPAVRPEPVRTR